MNINFVLFGILSFFALVNGEDYGNLSCYNCIATGAPVNEPTWICITDPENVPPEQSGRPIIPCPNGYCTVERIVTKGEPENSFYTFIRRCSPTMPVFTDEIIEDSQRITYNQCCRTSKCNIGDGTVHLGKECSAVSHILSLSILGFSVLVGLFTIYN